LEISLKAARFLSHRVRETIREAHFAEQLGGEGKGLQTRIFPRKWERERWGAASPAINVRTTRPKGTMGRGRRLRITLIQARGSSRADVETDKWRTGTVADAA